MWFGNEVNVRHAISKRRGTDGAHKWEWHVGPPKSRRPRQGSQRPLREVDGRCEGPPQNGSQC